MGIEFGISGLGSFDNRQRRVYCINSIINCKVCYAKENVKRLHDKKGIKIDAFSEFFLSLIYIKPRRCAFFEYEMKQSNVFEKASGYKAKRCTLI